MRHPRGDAGDSLVEILASLAVLAIGVTGLLTALGTHASTTIANRSQAQAATTLLAGSEWVKAQPFAACSPGAATAIPVATVPRDPGFTLTYGPAHAVDGSTPCSQLAIIPVQVTGDGFTLNVDVVKRP